MNRLVLTAVLLAAACGETETSELEELVTPVFIWEHRVGHCARVRAMDDEGHLWARRGCDDRTGLERRGIRLRPAEVAVVRGAFGRLRDGMVRDRAECPVSVHVFSVFRLEGVFEYLACGTSPDLGATTGLEDAFLDAARLVDHER